MVSRYGRNREAYFSRKCRNGVQCPQLRAIPPGRSAVSMKYRQPGYRDQDYKEEREKRREEDRGPRGPREPRGMAREARLVTRCYQCGHQQPALESVPTDALCSKCREIGRASCR